MSPALNERSVLRHFKRGKAIEIHDGIMLDFYLGLPQLPGAALVYLMFSAFPHFILCDQNNIQHLLYFHFHFHSNNHG